jgi:Na+/proline symporter
MYMYVGIFMGLLAIVLQAIGLSLGYVYLLMGVLVGSAVAPCFCTVVWGKLNGHAAAAAISLGFVVAVSSWLATAAALNDGVLSLATTGQDMYRHLRTHLHTHKYIHAYTHTVLCWWVTWSRYALVR